MIVDYQRLALDVAHLEALLDQWQARWPTLTVVAWLPEAERAGVALLQRACRERAIALAGAVFPALIDTHGFSNSGMWLICFDRAPRWALLTGDDTTELSQRLAQQVLAWGPQPDQAAGVAPILFSVFDAQLRSIASLLHGVYQQVGHAVRYAGVSAGSESFAPMPCLFDRDHCIGNGVLAFLFDEVRGVACRHAYPVSKALMRATSAEGNRILTINDRRALTVYQEVIAAEYGVTLTPENFYQYAVHYPFGVVTAMDVLVRIPVVCDDDGAIVCVGEIPPNSRLRLIQAPDVLDSQCVGAIAHELSTALRADAQQPVFAFYCAGRRLHFGAQAEQELDDLRARVGGRDLIGALSLGEVGALPGLGMPEFHNAAVVCMA